MNCLFTKFDSKRFQSVPDLLHRSCNVAFFQRAILGTEGDGLCHRLESMTDLRTFIDVEELAALQNLTAALDDHIFDLAC